jgi:hypothetical protein
VADILRLDRTFLLGKVVSENNPELWNAITTIMGDRLVSANEMALVGHVRAALDGHDVNLAESAVFTQAMAPILQSIVERQNELAKAAMNRSAG